MLLPAKLRPTAYGISFSVEFLSSLQIFPISLSAFSSESNKSYQYKLYRHKAQKNSSLTLTGFSRGSRYVGSGSCKNTFAIKKMNTMQFISLLLEQQSHPLFVQWVAEMRKKAPFSMYLVAQEF